MVRMPVVLAVGLVVGAVAIVWWSNSPEPANDSSNITPAGDSVLARENAALESRVADLEQQMSALTFAIDGLAERLAQEAERAGSQDAESAELMRDIQQRLAANRPDAAGQVPVPGVAVGAPPGSPFEGQAFIVEADGQSVRLLGPNGQPMTAETVAAAAATGNPMSAPPTLTGVQANSGQTLVFRVTGTTEGPVWGSDVYTDDSSIGAAAVHAGLLQPGETGTVMVTVQDGFPAYTATSRNGINSSPYGEWTRSYTMIRLN